MLKQRLVYLMQTPDGIEYRVGGSDGEIADTDLDDELRRYFRLDTDDIESIYVDLAGRDSRIGPLLKRYHGVHVLRQEPWECLASYICSARASAASIAKNVSALAEKYGNPVELAGETRRTFPAPEAPAQASGSQLRELGLGFQSPRVVAAVHQVTDNPGALERLGAMPYPDAKRRLMGYVGIDPKTADCVCLMALDKLEAFPVDRHIRRAVRDYFSSEPRATDATMVGWSQHHFGSYAGYAGQYRFLHRRQSSPA